MKRIIIAGGDMRMISCARRLSQDHIIGAAGFDSEHSDIAPAEGIYDIAVLPPVPLDDNGNITAPCYSSTLTMAELRGMLSDKAIIFTGKRDRRLNEFFPQCSILSYLDREEFSLKNAIPTAEGAVQLALEELPVTLNGMKVLIVGLGRIGTALTHLLKGFGADITAAVRDPKGAAKARIFGIKSVPVRDIPSDFGLVFNTAPELIFDAENLRSFSNDTLFIDLASKPGGIDLNAASALGLKVIWALGLPGKTAPVTAGEMIAETISDILAEGGESHG